jgi:hypothetical protein
MAPAPAPTRASLSRATGQAVIAWHLRRRSVVDFITADHRHGIHVLATGQTVMGVRPEHWAMCGPLFHRGVPDGLWRVKTHLEPALVTLEVLANTAAVLREEAIAGGWAPYGRLHTRWALVGPHAVVTAEIAVVDSSGNDRPVQGRRR